jgi:deoxycytidine triphosphate deaminase
VRQVENRCRTKMQLRQYSSKLSLKRNRGVVDPRKVIQAGFIEGVEQRLVQGNSVDLSIAYVYEIVGGLVLRNDGSRVLPDYKLIEPIDLFDMTGYVLSPDKLYQVEFSQTVKLPDYLCALTLVRSSMAKSGCSGENGLFDSGYFGSIGMMVKVSHETKLEVDSAIAQMMFFRSNAKKASYKGYYQGSVGPADWMKKDE